MKQQLNVMRLTLYAPLFYDPDHTLSPFAVAGKGAGETLFLFAIPQEQAFSIEPEPEGYLGAPLFAGTARVEEGSGEFALPAGNYLFAQARGELDAADVVWMAAEVQKDGLWEKRVLTDRLYLRRLFEHGGPVTQVFRPFR
ncbi:MAG: hypothetical protein LBD24_09220 [Spirochaetaceae bacterium]|jgi:hypothetical protein|nr:hypothetical protein [Spirochaetaceae bacterium]